MYIKEEVKRFIKFVFIYMIVLASSLGILSVLSHSIFQIRALQSNLYGVSCKDLEHLLKHSKEILSIEYLSSTYAKLALKKLCTQIMMNLLDTYTIVLECKTSTNISKQIVLNYTNYYDICTLLYNGNFSSCKLISCTIYSPS